MKTAVDSSVLLAILKGESSADQWVQKLIEARSIGPLVICEVVYAEVGSGFPDALDFEKSLEQFGIRFEPISSEAAFLAGKLFRLYRGSGGTRATLLPDFLIAAHAKVQAGCLAAIDTGYRRKYFPDLPVVKVET